MHSFQHGWSVCGNADEAGESPKTARKIVRVEMVPADNESPESCPADCTCGNGDCNENKHPNLPRRQALSIESLFGKCFDYVNNAPCQCDDFCLPRLIATLNHCDVSIPIFAFSMNAMLAASVQTTTDATVLNASQTAMTIMPNNASQPVDGAPNNKDVVTDFEPRNQRGLHRFHYGFSAMESVMMEKRPHPVAKIASAVMELVRMEKASSSALQIARAAIMSASSLRRQSQPLGLRQHKFRPASPVLPNAMAAPPTLAVSWCCLV